MVSDGGHDWNAEAEAIAFSVRQHPPSFVGDDDSQNATGFEFGSHCDRSGAIAISVEYGVGGGLRDGQLDRRDLLLTESAAVCKFRDGGANVANRLRRPGKLIVRCQPDG